MNNLIVSRFGGSEAANSEEVRKSAEVVRSDPSRRFIIVSAPGHTDDSLGITDMLYVCHSECSSKGNYMDMLGKVSDRYKEIVNGLGISFNVDAEINSLKSSLELGMNLDYIGSRGEYIMAKIFAEFLGWEFVDASEIVYFNQNGIPDKARTFRTAGERLKDIPRAVIPSFYGSLPDGKIKTFRRGDCDTAGALIACSVKADLFEKWSETAKIYSADPVVVPNSDIIRSITYNEVLELNYVGIKVVTDDVVFMLNEAGIPMRIGTTHNPEETEMFISPKISADLPRKLSVCISGRKNFNVIHIQKYGLNNEHSFGARLFTLFSKHNIACRHCLSGIHRLSVVIKTPKFEIMRNQILDDIRKTIAPDTVSVERGLSLIAVIGEGLSTIRGMFSIIFDALAASDIKVKMVDQGSDPFNIMLGVSDSDYDKAITTLYNALVK